MRDAQAAAEDRKRQLLEEAQRGAEEAKRAMLQQARSEVEGEKQRMIQMVSTGFKLVSIALGLLAFQVWLVFDANYVEGTSSGWCRV
jgi:F0F1-type ATP synthase membrane subunit b/b'